ncbi:MAG: hypothetical protein WA749_07350 [Gelidibacter sp.]
MHSQSHEYLYKSNKKEDLSVDKKFVNTQKNNNKNVILEQTFVEANGAAYGKGVLIWRSEG